MLIFPLTTTATGAIYTMYTSAGLCEPPDRVLGSGCPKVKLRRLSSIVGVNQPLHEFDDGDRNRRPTFQAICSKLNALQSQLAPTTLAVYESQSSSPLGEAPFRSSFFEEDAHPVYLVTLIQEPN